MTRPVLGGISFPTIEGWFRMKISHLLIADRRPTRLAWKYCVGLSMTLSAHRTKPVNGTSTQKGLPLA